MQRWYLPLSMHAPANEPTLLFAATPQLLPLTALARWYTNLGGYGNVDPLIDSFSGSTNKEG